MHINTFPSAGEGRRGVHGGCWNGTKNNIPEFHLVIGRDSRAGFPSQRYDLPDTKMQEHVLSTCDATPIMMMDGCF